MNKNILFTIFLLLIALFISGSSYGLWYAFAHPDMTNTRLFLRLWHVYVVVVICGVAIVMINKKLWDKKRISEVTYSGSTLTIHYTDGTKEKYEGQSTVWHKHPYMERAGVLTEGWLSEIYSYIKKWGNPYPTAHLNKKETP